MNRHLLILSYHRVAEPPPGFRTGSRYVTPPQFAWQLGRLARSGARVTTLRELAAESFGAKAAREDSAPPRIVITFDGGTEDIFRNAYPLLRWHGFSAVIFPYMEQIVGAPGIPPGDAGSTSAPLLTEAQLQTMATEGFEFGARLPHGVSLIRLPDAELRRELLGARMRLAELVGGDIVSVAYPCGTCDERMTAAAAAAGFRCGVSADSGTLQDRGALRLRRMAVRGTRWYHHLQYAALLRRYVRRFRDG